MGGGIRPPPPASTPDKTSPPLIGLKNDKSRTALPDKTSMDELFSNNAVIILYKWGAYTNDVFEQNINFVCEQIVYWRKNLFLLPTGKLDEDILTR